MIVFSSSWIAVSIYTIVIIALERHRSVAHPFKQKLSKTNAITTIILITCFSMFIQAPNMLHMKNVDMLDHEDCVRDWPPSDSKYWDLFFFHISFLFPVIVNGSVLISDCTRSYPQKSQKYCQIFPKFFCSICQKIQAQSQNDNLALNDHYSVQPIYLSKPNTNFMVSI